MEWIVALPPIVIVGLVLLARNAGLATYWGVFVALLVGVSLVWRFDVVAGPEIRDPHGFLLTSVLIPSGLLFAIGRTRLLPAHPLLACGVGVVACFVAVAVSIVIGVNSGWLTP